MRKQFLGLMLVPALVAAVVVACDDEESNPQTATDAGSDTGTTSDSGPAKTDAGDTDAAKEPEPVVTLLTDFAIDGGVSNAEGRPIFEFPEGVVTIPNDGGFGTPVVSFTSDGTTVKVQEDGGYAPYFSAFSYNPGDAPNNWVLGFSRQLGMTNDANDIFLGVGGLPQDAGVGNPPKFTPPPGVYKFGAGAAARTVPTKLSGAVVDGGVGPTAFSIKWPAGLDLNGGSIFVADSGGVNAGGATSTGGIYKVNVGTGETTLWLTGAALDGNKAACPGKPTPAPRPFGATWVQHDANNVYVANFDLGSIVKIPVNQDGSPGTPVPVIQGLSGGGTDCTYQGIRGFVIDKDGTFLFAGSLTNAIYRASADGKTIKPVVQGKPPLDQPAGLWVDTNPATGKRRLLVTNFALQTYNQNAGPKPSLIAIDNVLAP